MLTHVGRVRLVARHGREAAQAEWRSSSRSVMQRYACRLQWIRRRGSPRIAPHTSRRSCTVREARRGCRGIAIVVVYCLRAGHRSQIM